MRLFLLYEFSYASAVGPPKFIGKPSFSGTSISPCSLSNLLILSCNALYKRFACCGVKMILDFTFAFANRAGS